MNFTPGEKTIRNLFKSGCQFVIPRFQREYSWEKKNYREFFEDMMNNLTVEDGKISDDQYFLGTMLFVGNFADKPDKPIEVVDGQQRMTTITILFSALSDRFIELGEETLSKQIFNYIMTSNDDGVEVRVLQSRSSYPYFLYYIQDREKKIEDEPCNEEERCIKETYLYFIQQTSEDNLKKLLKKKTGSDIVDALSHIDILKALRDQVLNCTFISIAAADKDQANKIFAILNSKGKRLVYIDLIKNEIFEEMREGVEGAFAEETWEEIKTILNSGEETVGLATYFRHFWISKYNKCGTNLLYDNFKKRVHKNKKEYQIFLENLKDNARNYMKIVNPNYNDYDNRKEYYWLVQALNAFNKTFNVVQTRIALLALFEVKQKKLISQEQFKKAILAMENFHLAFTAVCSLRTNNLESVYSAFARELRNCRNTVESANVVQAKLITPLDKYFPSCETFVSKFKDLVYSKADNPSNMKCKYVINKLNSYISHREIFEVDGSIEHILPEKTNAHALNIGNLILLEVSLNREADQMSYTDKIKIYNKSAYTWVHQFVEKNKSWTEDMIDRRGIELAKLYYRDILQRKMPN